MATYKVTATSAQSGVATTSFTDGNIRIQARPTGTSFDGSFTVYSGANCTGTAEPTVNRNSQHPRGPVGSANSNDFSDDVAQTSSLKIEAAAVNSAGNGFNNFTANAPNDASLIIQNGSFDPASSPRIICINGNFTGGKTFFANYFTSNQAPVNPVPAALQSTNEDTALTFNSANNNLVSISDVDAGSNAVKVTLSVTNGKLTLSGTTGLTFTTGSNGTANMTFTGTIANINSALSGLKFDPDGNYNGSAALTITTDDQGNTGTGGAKSDTDTVNINVTPVDDNPVAVNDNKTVAEDANATALDVLTNDTDVDGGPKSIQSATDPDNGTVVVTGGGSGLTYKPDENYCNGGSPTDYFTYTLNGGSTATVVVTVTCVNDAPVAEDQSVTTDEDIAKDITLGATDVDEGDTLSYTIVSEPQHGTLSGTGANLTYTPNENYNGPDSFTFKANDGQADSNVATVSITVTAVNDAPAVTNLQGADTANEGEIKAYTFQITDDDSSNFTFASGSPNCGGTGKGELVSGTAQINGNNGTFQCKFLDGGVPPTQVTVSAQVTDDSQASSEAATKNVSVSNVPPKIDSLTGPAQVLTNQPVTFTGAHSDPAGLLDNPFTWQWSGGTSTDTDKNNSYVTKFSACGPQTVKATVTDKDTGTSAEATLSTPVQAYNGNWLPPLQVGKDNIVQKGQVVPVKISVAGCDGINKAGLNPEIRLAKGDPTVGINEADYAVPGIVAAADTSGVMRPVSDGYIYNLRIPSDASVKANDMYTIRVSPFGVVAGQHMVIAVQIRK